MTGPKAKTQAMLPPGATMPMDMTQQVEAKAVYGAMIWASSNGCTCQSCQILKRLYARVTSQIADEALKDLEEG